jgi:DNA repair exonuclease SbcCD nuclease subunit
MRIQYVSDIHLEHYTIQTKDQLNPEQWITPDSNADLLVLAGDIGNPNKTSYGLFLDWCSKHWPQVVVIAGNHEFYTLSTSKERLNYYETTNLIRSITSHYTNVHFLDRGRLEISPGVHILGCTLWSGIPDELKKYAVQGINDFRLIPEMTFEAYKDYHTKDLDWLTTELEELSSKGEKAIVVTHHLPTEALISKKYMGHPMNCCFYTELTPLIKRTAPLAWICGHSHTGNQLVLEGENRRPIFLALNPHGYPGERVETRTKMAVLSV